MKTQLTTILRWLISMVYGLLSDPLRLRVTLTIVVLCLALAALLLPAMTTLADGLSGGGSFGSH